MNYKVLPVAIFQEPLAFNFNLCAPGGGLCLFNRETSNFLMIVYGKFEIFSFRGKNCAVYLQLW